ncbi:hypothetical protein EYC84_001664 [Monilinia fructicola]|uniref:Uncharacterized protein n=1 Tax=Monilinia fructicola TaxID=38448 RepID=A0A5M9JQ86_MONFR|nr:hypothetical protein EYC84_001664 [Monilinia fructicola]
MPVGPIDVPHVMQHGDLQLVICTNSVPFPPLVGPVRRRKPIRPDGLDIDGMSWEREGILSHRLMCAFLLVQEARTRQMFRHMHVRSMYVHIMSCGLPQRTYQVVSYMSGTPHARTAGRNKTSAQIPHPHRCISPVHSRMLCCAERNIPRPSWTRSTGEEKISELMIFGILPCPPT